MALLSLKLNADLGHTQLNINEQIKLDGIVGLFGHSGAGKSTILKAIAGIDTPINGSIKLNNQCFFDSENQTNLPIHQRNIVGVFQHDALFSHLTVKENLFFGRKRLKSATLDVDKLIESVGLTALLNSSVEQLSGGEKQKVALLQAILAEPQLLILDEPLSALDKINKQRLHSTIKSLQQLTSIPIIYVSHDIHEIQALCSMMYVIEHGKIVQKGGIDRVVHWLNHSDLITMQTSFTLYQKTIDTHHGLYQYTLSNGEKVFGTQAILTSGDKQEHHPDSAQTQAYLLASDISICTDAPSNSSIVNQLIGVISVIEQEANQVMIKVNCNGQPFYVSISSYSLDKLALKLGQQIYIQFKASAIKMAS